MFLIQYMLIKLQKEKKNNPNDEELIIIGLIYDLGVLFSFGEESYSVVGDTRTKSEFGDSIIYNELESPEYKKYIN